MIKPTGNKNRKTQSKHSEKTKLIFVLRENFSVHYHTKKNDRVLRIPSFQTLKDYLNNIYETENSLFKS